MIKIVIGSILLFLLIFWHTLISYICIAVYILIVGSLRWRVELVISITDININSTGVKSRTARKNCVRLNVINYVISKKEKKNTIFVNWDVCVKKCTVQWVYILIFQWILVLVNVLCKHFLWNQNSDSIWSFQKGKDFHLIKQALVHVFYFVILDISVSLSGA